MNVQGREYIHKISESRVRVDHRPRGCSSSTRACYVCNKVGHIAVECTKSNKLGTYGNRHCYNCSKYGHLARNCSNKLGSAGTTGGSSIGSGIYRGRGTCYNCGESGHLWRECPKRLQEEDHEEQLLQLHNSYSSWSDIPTDIFTLVTERLPVDDVIHLGVVCKTWQQAIRVQPRCRASMPWVMHFLTSTDKASSCKFKISDFWRNRTYPLDRILNKDMKELCHNYHGKFRVCDSKYGWLLLFFEHKSSFTYPRKVQFLFSNPFRNVTIKLPSLYLAGDEHVGIAKFMTTPSGRPPTCNIVFMCHHQHRNYQETSDYMLYTCNEDRRWSRYKIDALQAYRQCDVAYADETFFCAFHSFEFVVMGTFSVALQRFTIDPSLFLGLDGFDHLYLVEFDGDLYSFTIKHGVCHVYQLDRSRKVWTRIKSLGNRVLILCDRSSSIVVPAVGEAEEYADMIFLYGNDQRLAFISDTEGTWRLNKQHDLGDSSRECICIQPPNLQA